MVTITKDESIELRKRYPKLHIVRTMKGRSSRGKYYCEENRSAMYYLRQMRKRNVVEEYK